MPVIHFRHCERSAAIHGCALRAMDRHGLRPRDDEGILVISTSLRTAEVRPLASTPSDKDTDEKS